MKHFDVAIIGAGASGLMCAIQCGLRGRKTAIIDHAGQSAPKVRVSGGGKCNFTNLHASAEDYVSSNPHFVKSALARYSPWDFLEFMEKTGGLKVVDQGRGMLFCATSAADVVRLLERQALKTGGELFLDTEVRGASNDGGVFSVGTSAGEIKCSSLVVACGGLAWPQIGATNLGYDLGKAFSLSSTPLRPGLAPLIAGKDFVPICESLAGVSLPVRFLQAPTGIWDMLFTHRGVSGPATLDASLYWEPGRELNIDLLPGTDIMEVLAKNPRLEIGNALARMLPRRLALALAGRHGWKGTIATTLKKKLAAMAETLHAYPFTPAATGGFNKAEVTLGGIDTDQISSKTMEAKSVPGLYFTGEVLDVTGRLGGYNLHWAWSSGFAAGQWA